MLRTLIQGGSILVALRKLLQGVRRGIQAIYKFATKGEGSMSIKDYCWGRKTRHQAKKLIWKSTPVLMPGKFHGWRNLVGYSPLASQRVGHDWTTSLHFASMCGKMQASRLTEFIPFICTSRAKSLIVSWLFPPLIPCSLKKWSEVTQSCLTLWPHGL